MGVYQVAPLAASLLWHPPTPPHHAQGRVEGGEIPRMTSRSRRGFSREVLSFRSRPPRKEGAGKAGCALHPRSRVQNCAKKRTRAYRFSGSSPAFPAQWFYGLCRALPGDRAFLSPSFAKIASRKLDAGVEASGPHDFAVRQQNALVRSAACDHRIQPRVRDDRDTPLEWGGWLRIYK